MGQAEVPGVVQVITIPRRADLLSSEEYGFYPFIYCAGERMIYVARPVCAEDLRRYPDEWARFEEYLEEWLKVPKYGEKHTPP
jgi:hypothetical protein